MLYVPLLSVCLSMPKLTCSKFICSTNDVAYLTHNEGVKFVEFSLQLLSCRARVLPALLAISSPQIAHVHFTTHVPRVLHFSV